jgi:hypothetical protein
MPSTPESNNPYVCALTGIEAADGALAYDAPEDDDLEALPVGWLRITFERRLPNPRHLALMELKRIHRAQQAAQLPKELKPAERESAEAMIEVQVDATFHAIESDTPPYLTETDVAYISDPAKDASVAKAFIDVRAALGLETSGAAGAKKAG